MKIVCLGDSLTYGYGVPRRRNWVSLTAARTGFEMVNRGVNGDTSGGMLARLGALIGEDRPDLLLAMGGLNDLMIGVSVKTICANLFAIAFQSANKGVQPVLAIPPMGPASGQAHRSGLFSDFTGEEGEKRRSLYREYAEWLRKLASVENFWLVDLERVLDGEDGMPQAAFFCDGVHPSEEGHERIARAVSETLAGRLCGERGARGS